MVTIIDEEDHCRTVDDPFGVGRQPCKCLACHTLLDVLRFTTNWCRGDAFCSPECRDRGVRRAQRERRRTRRCQRQHALARLEEVKVAFRCITVPRAMLRNWGYRVWKGAGKPQGNCDKRDGKWIKWDGRRGAVQASYSGDTMPSGEIRKPFAIGSELFIYMGGCSWDVAVEVYKVVLPTEFTGPTWTYQKKVEHDRKDDDLCNGEFARRDPHGFYHGMTCRHGKQAYVLQGPQVYLLPGPRLPKPAKQKSLF